MATKTGDNTNNWMRGTADNDTLNGMGGDDVLWGLGGDDHLGGGNDRDVLIGGTGNDVLYGGAGNDVLFGGEGDSDYFYGGPGADLMVGSGGSKVTAFYNLGREGVTVNLATRRGQGGEAEGDELIGIPRVMGSNYGDTLTGDEQDNYFWWTRGADVLDGGSGIDTLSYFFLPSDQAVTVDMGVTDAEGWTRVTGADGEDDKLKNIENLDGSRGDDTLRGDENANKLWGRRGRDVLEGRGGADTLDGGSDNDTASYAHSPGGVTVDLTLTGPQATENNHDAAGDTLIRIENLEGSNYGDTLTGDEQDNYFWGKGGADVVDGGGGIDTVSFHYLRSNQGVTVDLGVTDAEGWTTVTGGDGEGDKLKNIENLDGGHGADTLRGDENANNFWGGGGNDELEGRGGADTLDGGLAWDIASYAHSPGGVTVDLTLTGPQATENNHDAAGDTLIRIENLEGSNYSDRLTGDDGPNWLVGGAGTDYLYGGDGNDVLWSEAQDNSHLPWGKNTSEQVYGHSLPDYLYGEDGNDHLRGGDGNDTIEGGDGHDWLVGEDGNDILKGGDGNDELQGYAGNDVLEGGIGNDYLNGRAGADRLEGGTGDDRFVFTSESVVDTSDEEETRTLADETDTVKDFTPSEGDSLELHFLKRHSLFTGGTTPGRGLSLLNTEGAAFTGVKGQVRWWQDDQTGTDNDVTHVQVDLDGDGNANFQVDLTGLHSLTGADFSL